MYSVVIYIVEHPKRVEMGLCKNQTYHWQFEFVCIKAFCIFCENHQAVNCNFVIIEKLPGEF